MSKKPNLSKDDILAFLDSKFSKLDQKPKHSHNDKKREQKQQDKESLKNESLHPPPPRSKTTVPQKSLNINTEVKQSIGQAPIVQALQIMSQSASPMITDDIIYKQMQDQTQAQKNESLNQFKTFQLKNPQIYDNELKNKIFFIGQNALSLTQDQGCQQQQQQDLSIKQQVTSSQKRQIAQKSKHLSKNTLKQLEKMQSLQLEEGPKYETFAKLHKIWQQYISTLLSKDDPTKPEHQASICSKIVKADLTGAKITVVDSKNKSLIGVQGIVTRESVRCLFIIQKEGNQCKNLIKAGSVFEIELPATHGSGNYGVKIWGDNIIYLGSERTKVRFKEKYCLDLY